jgi:hypothetical protein
MFVQSVHFYTLQKVLRHKVITTKFLCALNLCDKHILELIINEYYRC